jgi:hypothetical protein
MAVETQVTKFGPVYRDVGGCKDDYKNIVTSSYYRKPSGIVRRRRRATSITMQKPAIEALRVVEAHMGMEVVVTGSSRSCELQAALYKKDPNRYAPPNVGLHCQALAIDVNTTWRAALSDKEEAQFLLLMKQVGFTQARPDEPWHFSYGWTA